MRNFVASATFLFLAFYSVLGYKYFQTKIPNGEGVPHPCKPNYLWKGVGHENAEGGGARNPFGIDFLQAGGRWTVDLCRKDSDGDGRTNGQELGDPNCVWTEGNAPEILIGLSHPGVCEPFDSPACKAQNSWVDCSTVDFTCDALDRENPADLLNVTLRFTETQVPPTETNYYCMTFDLNLNDDYHLIASQPIINNAYVMHHILLFGCEDGAPPQTTPGPCGMGLGKCLNMIGGWTVGQHGDCLHDQAGFPVGTKGFKRVALQFHWNNPELRSDYTDSSGMLLHLTKNKRTYNLGMLTVGETNLKLPPGEERVEAVGHCTAEMTSWKLTGPVYFTSANNHMHYLGRQMRMEHIRNGVKLRDIAFDEVYSYDSPITYHFQNGIEFRPGDEIKTTCVFKTTSRSRTVFLGDGTSDEMCYGFISFYPAENMVAPYCVSYNSLDAAEPYYKPVVQNCPYSDFLNTSNPDTQRLHQRVLSHCSHLGLCLKECPPVLEEVGRHPCMHGDISFWIRDLVRNDGANHMQLALFLSAFDSCATEMALKSCPKYNDPTLNASPSKSSSVFVLATLSLFLLGI